MVPQRTRRYSLTEPFYSIINEGKGKYHIGIEESLILTVGRPLFRVLSPCYQLSKHLKVSSITSRIHYYLYLHRLFVSRRILAEMTEANVYQQTVSWKSYPRQNWPGQKQKEHITRRRATWNPSGVSVVVPWKWLYGMRIVEVRRKGEKGKEEDSLTLGRQEEDRMTGVELFYR